MQRNYSNSTVPYFRRGSGYNFDARKIEATRESLAVFDELNAIAEEIERCRARNCGELEGRSNV